MHAVPPDKASVRFASHASARRRVPYVLPVISTIVVLVVAFAAPDALKTTVAGLMTALLGGCP